MVTVTVAREAVIREWKVALISDVMLPVTCAGDWLPCCRHRWILAGVSSQQINERTWKRTPLLGGKWTALIRKTPKVFYRFRESFVCVFISLMKNQMSNSFKFTLWRLKYSCFSPSFFVYSLTSPIRSLCLSLPSSPFFISPPLTPLLCISVSSPAPDLHP